MNYLGHDYFLTTRPMLSDLATLLNAADSPPPRLLLKPVVKDGYGYWQFGTAP